MTVLVRELREAVEQEDERTVGGLEAGLEDVHLEAVAVGDDARADARGEGAGAVEDVRHG